MTNVASCFADRLANVDFRHPVLITGEVAIFSSVGALHQFGITPAFFHRERAAMVSACISARDVVRTPSPDIEPYPRSRPWLSAWLRYRASIETRSLPICTGRATMISLRWRFSA